MSNNNTEKQSSNGDCFSLFFNIIISQLFVGAISSIIDFLRLITINILTKFFISEITIRKYGIYIQPVVTFILLLFVGFLTYYIITSLTSLSCNRSILIYYFFLFALLSVLIGYVIWVFYQLKALKEKKNILKYIKKKKLKF